MTPSSRPPASSATPAPDPGLGAAAAAATALPESRVLVLATGGTICMQQGPDGLAPAAGFLESAMAPRPMFNDMSGGDVLLQAYPPSSPSATLPLLLPSLRTPPTSHNRHIRYTLLEFTPLLDSSSISAADWTLLATTIHANYPLYDGFVVLHGTDSLAYTASALSFLMPNLGKPVILTGSQSPIFALQSDAPDNLLGALVLAGTYTIPEVALFFHHKLYRGNRTTKISAASFEAFASPNYGPLAEVNGLGVTVHWSRVLRPTAIAEFAPPAYHLDTAHVACLRVFPGIRPEMVDAVLKLPSLRGLILETFGMGNVPGGGSPDGPLTSVIRDAVEKRGVVVVNVSQCVAGFVSPVYAPATHLGRAGVIFGLDLTPEAALTKLSYLLSLPGLTSIEDITRQFARSLRGEMTEIAHPTFSHPTETPLERVASSLLTAAESAFAALGYAIQNGQMSVVRRLLAGDDGTQLLKTADYAGNTAVHLAAVSGNSDIMLELLKLGASVHERNRADNSPLFLATLSGNEHCADLLRSAGAHLSIEEIERGPLAKYRRENAT